jgi:deoxyribodipyrimidine photo-lyase
MTKIQTNDQIRFSVGLVWLRRDLRLQDNTALSHALKHCDKVFIAFVFDTDILKLLPSKQDRRVEFIWQSVVELHKTLQTHGSQLLCAHGSSLEVIASIAQLVKANAVFTNHDYEPAAIERDQQVQAQLQAFGCELKSFKDQVIFEKAEVLTATGTPFSVFTPYKNAWLKRHTEKDHLPKDCDLDKAQRMKQWGALAAKGATYEIPSLSAMGFATTNLQELKIAGGSQAGLALLHEFADRIDGYKNTRDYPAIQGPSYLSVHFRFGTVSIRQACRLAFQAIEGSPANSEGARTWLSELIWRDFYFQILHHHPRVVTGAFKADYNLIAWEQDERLERFLTAWKTGQTGYPLVDAAMAQLNQTGYMHNRLRMVVASFLMKDLGIDWRLGEQYFADQLNDFDLSANNGGWQWAASSGCDAQPYFRIFNPITQSEKFDSEGKFIKRYLPQLKGLSKKAIHAPWLAGPLELQAADVVLGKNYPLPVVQHDEARALTLKRYAVVKRNVEELGD